MTPSSGAASQKETESLVSSTKHGIVVLDFGGQYTQLIARRVREQQVFSAVLPCTAKLDEIRAHEPVGIILSGGPSSVYDKDAPYCDPKVLDLDVPVLGICYGMQTMAAQLGGQVESASHREFGAAQVRPSGGSRLLYGLEDNRDAGGRPAAG